MDLEYPYPEGERLFAVSEECRLVLDECMSSAAAYGRRTGCEAFYAIDAENAAVLVGHESDHRSVELEDEDRRLLRHCPDRSLILVHNHPGYPAAPSPTDVDVAVSTTFVKFSVVVADDGSCWYLAVGKDVPWLDRSIWWHGIYKAGRQFRKDVIAAYGPEFVRWWNEENVEDLAAARDAEVFRALREALAENLVLRLDVVHRLPIAYRAFGPCGAS